MVGYEADHAYSTSPAGTSIIAHSPVRSSGFSDMATYVAGKATVFATGSMQWSWGLDDTDYHPHGRISAAVQQMTRNVLAKFAGKSVPPPTNLISAVGPLGSINSSYTDDFLALVITDFPRHLRFARLKRGRIGVARIVQEESNDA